MIAGIAIIAITLLTVAYFYLKSPIMMSFATMITVFLAAFLAFNYYESLANFFISSGRAGQWAQGLCLLLIFAATIGLIRFGLDYIVGANIDFGTVSTKITALITGGVSGLIISGIFVISLSLMPLNAKIPYSRFAGDSLDPRSPKKATLNADGLTASIIQLISKGSLSSSKNFGMIHPDFITEIHLNRVKPAESTSSRSKPQKTLNVAARDAVTIPKNGVRIKDFGEHSRTVVRIGIEGKEVKDGGAMDSTGKIKFALSQVRLVCKNKNSSTGNAIGNGMIVYPDKYKLGGKAMAKEPELSEVITFERADLKNRIGWIDIAFNVPSDLEATFLQFKSNTLVELPKTVESTIEIEQLLLDQVFGKSDEK
jgi:hypothetical protein